MKTANDTSTAFKLRMGIAAALVMVSGAIALAQEDPPAAPASPVPAAEKWNVYGGGQPLFDEQTELRRWQAGVDALAGVPDEQLVIETPAVRGRPPHEVVGQGAPVYAWQGTPGTEASLDFGELGIGVYVVRVIAMVRTEDIEQYRKPVYVEMQVNDKPGGGTNVYRHRVPYWDELFAVTELYFNVDEQRAYEATLRVGEASQADLLIHRIEFHDVLGGLPRVAAKQKPGYFTYEEREQLRRNANPQEVWKLVRNNVSLDAPLRVDAEPLSPEARRERDELLWHAFPPLNGQFVAEYDESGFFQEEMHPGEMNRSEAEAEYGTWELASNVRNAWRTVPRLVNEKLGLEYTRDDMAAHRPLPDPYPFKDDGAGVYFPQQGSMPHARHYAPVPLALGQHWTRMWDPVAGWHGSEVQHRLAYLYHALGHENAAHDAALILARWAYTYPTHTDQQTLGYAMIAPASRYNRDLRLQQRAVMFYWGSSRGANLNGGLNYTYDYLFDYIQGNQELADAVGRFVPWVKTDEDVRRLIETRIVQYGAKQAQRFHLTNSKNHPTFSLRPILVQQNPELADAWMARLFERTMVYPHGAGGLPDFLSTTTQRDGTTTIGSVSYTHRGSPLADLVAETRRYVENGGDPQFDLSDLRLYGKMAEATRFPLDSSVAGGYPMNIGDVGGVDKPRILNIIGNFDDNWARGWAWTGDRRMAWLLKHYVGRTNETDEQWAAIESAAAEQGRNPLLAQRSRVMANWAGVLEAGQEHDDYRYKRTAVMRVGTGHGHAHSNTLDLQLFAHGVRIASTLGWRGAYSQPSAGDTLMQNRVEVNGRNHPREGNWQGHAWIADFKPAPGAQYMHGVAVPPGSHARNTQSFTRTIALIDVDQGSPLPDPAYPGLYTGNDTPHDRNAVTPNSYVFDVQRMDGGTWHTFAFHGPWSDQFEVNLTDRVHVGQGTSGTPNDDALYLRKFLDGENLKYAGQSPDMLVATWRLRRDEERLEGAHPYTGETVSRDQHNAERHMLGVDFNPEGPAKFMRLHLPGRGGDRVLVGHPLPQGPEGAASTWPYLFVQRRNEEPAATVYAAILEPYAGQPFVQQVERLTVQDNEDDAAQAVAMRVMTTNGHEDWLFSDGRDAVRRVGSVEVAARFAMVSKDEQGVRVAHIVGGEQLTHPDFFARISERDHHATIDAVDYLDRRITLRTALPAALWQDEQIEIGNEHHRTSFGVVAAEQSGPSVVLTLDKPIDLSYARVRSVDPEAREVTATIGPESSHPGMNRGLTLTNEDMSKAWKVQVLGARRDRGFVYRADSAMQPANLPEGTMLRLWEFGVGDAVRLPTHLHLHRLDDQPGRYELRTNARVMLRLGAGAPAVRITPADMAAQDGVMIVEMKQ